MSKKKPDRDIINWLEWEIDCDEADVDDAEQRLKKHNEALKRHKKTGSLSKDMRKEYNDWKRE